MIYALIWIIMGLFTVGVHFAKNDGPDDDGMYLPHIVIVTILFPMFWGDIFYEMYLHKKLPPKEEEDKGTIMPKDTEED